MFEHNDVNRLMETVIKKMEIKSMKDTGTQSIGEIEQLKI